MSVEFLEKDKVIYFLNELIHGEHSENIGDIFYNKIDMIIEDPKWSNYIFWSDEYIYPNGEINYEKFFQKIAEYEHSDEYKRNKYIISLVKDLLDRNFQEKSEVTIVNELHSLISNHDWVDCLFVRKDCFLENGELNGKEFLKSMGLIDFEESSLTYHFKHD